MPPILPCERLLKPYLLNSCGYKADLVQANYRLRSDQPVGLAAFAHDPPDARSACIAAIDCKSNDPKTEVLRRRELAAPLVFACHENRLQVWKPGPDDAECIEAGLSAGQLSGFF